MNDETKDPIDEAIAETEQPEPQDSMVAHLTLTSGRTITIQVPKPFGPAEFEAAVVALTKLRDAWDESELARQPRGLLLPQRPRIVRPS